jgi:hypothetical protein
MMVDISVGEKEKRGLSVKVESKEISFRRTAGERPTHKFHVIGSLFVSPSLFHTRTAGEGPTHKFHVIGSPFVTPSLCPAPSFDHQDKDRSRHNYSFTST